jgi:hypothetical protein
MRMKQVSLLVPVLLAVSSIPAPAAIEMHADAIGSVAGPAMNGSSQLGVTVGLPVCGVATNGQSEETVGFWWWMRSAPSAVEIPGEEPRVTGVSLSGPNPFAMVTTLQLRIAASGEANQTRLEVFDVSGRSVTTLVDEPLAPGVYHVVWDRRDRSGHVAPSGVYFARFASGAYHRTIRLVAAG